MTVWERRFILCVGEAPDRLCEEGPSHTHVRRSRSGGTSSCLASTLRNTRTE